MIPEKYKIKIEIKKLFKNNPNRTFYYLDISDMLDISLHKSVKACEELIKEGYLVEEKVALEGRSVFPKLREKND